MSETAVQNAIRLALGRMPTVKLFRNQVGEGWMGTVLSKTSETVTLRHPRRVTMGLEPGSSDLIGWTAVVITPDMVGKTLAVFTSPEVKIPSIKRLPEHQQRWCNAVNKAGGIAGMVRSPDEALLLVRTRRW